MTIKNGFKLAARILGLIIVINGLRTAIDFILILFIGDFTPLFIAYILAVALFSLIGGAYLLRGAPALIEFAFGRESGAPDFETDE